MITYKAYVKVDNIKVIIEVPSIGDILDGFWINDDYEFTKGSDCSIWIPITSVAMVRKVDSEKI